MDGTTINTHAYAQVCAAVLATGAKTATKYLSPKLTVRGTLHGKLDKRARRVTLAVSIGSPNYAERQFIKDCIKAREPFPLRDVQLKYPPVKRKAAARLHIEV